METPMTTPDYRAALAALLQAIDDLPWEYDWRGNPVGVLAELDDAPLERARALLAAPEAVGVSYAEISDLARECVKSGKSVEWAILQALTYYGTAHPAPVPVGERLPGDGEWVWHCYAGVRFWQHGIHCNGQFFIGNGPESQPATHWQHSAALPLPGPQP